uniref:hypothetical protein n=1 Tax=Neisseria subflava TaxID=28449 RepID=UPI001F27EDD9
DVFGDHGLCGLLEEGAHEKSPKCLGGNLGDFGEFCKGLRPSETDRGRFQTAFFESSKHLMHGVAD